MFPQQLISPQTNNKKTLSFCRLVPKRRFQRRAGIALRRLGAAEAVEDSAGKEGGDGAGNHEVLKMILFM